MACRDQGGSCGGECRRIGHAARGRERIRNQPLGSERGWNEPYRPFPDRNVVEAELVPSDQGVVLFAAEWEVDSEGGYWFMPLMARLPAIRQ